MSDRDREFAEFVLASSAALQRTAYLVCADRHHAHDAVQDALYKLYLAWPRVQRSDNVLAYARRAVVNAATEAGRRPWRRERATEQVPETGVRDATSQHAERDEMLGALRALPPRRRACIALRYYEGLSVEETAEVLGCTTGTVKSQTARGLDTLRHQLSQLRSASRQP